jgi:hypothetical protein
MGAFSLSSFSSAFGQKRKYIGPDAFGDTGAKICNCNPCPHILPLQLYLYRDTQVTRFDGYVIFDPQESKLVILLC